jgi:HEAT repeat protein
LNGTSVNPAILSAMQAAPPKTQVAALGVLGTRSAVDQFDAILKLTSSPDQTIRRAAIQSLGEFVQAPQVPTLLAVVEKASVNDLPLWEKTLITASTLGDRSKAVEALVKVAENASPDQLRILLPAINATGSDSAREVLIGKLKSPDESIRRTVVSSMGRSKSAAYLTPLLAAAREDGVPALRRLALRNVIEIAAEPTLDSATALQTLQSATDLAQNSDDRKAILAALSAVKANGSLQLISQIASADPSVASEATAASQKIGTLPSTQ